MTILNNKKIDSDLNKQYNKLHFYSVRSVHLKSQRQQQQQSEELFDCVKCLHSHHKRCHHLTSNHSL